MTYLCEKISGAYVGGNTVNVSAALQGTWEDGPSIAMAGLPQTVDTSIGDSGNVESVSVDLTGGEEIGPNGVGYGVTSVSYGRSRIGVVADGFRPNAEVAVRSVGPGGVDISTAQADSGGVVEAIAELPASGASFQPGQKIPGGSFTISDNNRTVAELGAFPGPLWGDLYYALEGRFGGSAQLVRTYPVWKHGGTVKWIIGVYLPPRDFYNEPHKAYSDAVYAGRVDTHAEITDDTPATRTLMQGERYKLHFNSYDRFDGYRAKPGDAVFIRPTGSQAHITLELDGHWSHHSGAMAYIIKNGGGYLRDPSLVSPGFARTTLKQGEVLIISSVSLGVSKKSLRRVYPWNASPEGSAIYDTGVEWYPIPTRAKIYRRAPGGVVAATFWNPGRGRLRIGVS